MTCSRSLENSMVVTNDSIGTCSCGLYYLPFETSGTVSCGTTGIKYIYICIQCITHIIIRTYSYIHAHVVSLSVSVHS